MVYKNRIVVSSGREIVTVEFEDEPNNFYVLRSRGGSDLSVSGPFQLADQRFANLPNTN